MRVLRIDYRTWHPVKGLVCIELYLAFATPRACPADPSRYRSGRCISFWKVLGVTERKVSLGGAVEGGSLKRPWGGNVQLSA